MLHPANGLHLIGVSLGTVLIIVSELALTSVSLENVLVSTVTGELVGHPPIKERGRGRGRGEAQHAKIRARILPV